MMHISYVLAEWAERTSDAPAILAPGRYPLTYSHLWKHVDGVGQTLYAMGLRCHDRVTLVLPNGPELATAFLALTTSVTCTILDPTYTANESALYLTELRVRALVVQAG